MVALMELHPSQFWGIIEDLARQVRIVRFACDHGCSLGLLFSIMYWSVLLREKCNIFLNGAFQSSRSSERQRTSRPFDDGRVA